MKPLSLVIISLCLLAGSNVLLSAYAECTDVCSDLDGDGTAETCATLCRDKPTDIPTMPDPPPPPSVPGTPVEGGSDE